MSSRHLAAIPWGRRHLSILCSLPSSQKQNKLTSVLLEQASKPSQSCPRFYSIQHAHSPSSTLSAHCTWTCPQVLSRNCLTAAGRREHHSLSWDIFSCSSHERSTLLKLDSSSSCLGRAQFSMLVPHPGPRHHLLKTQPSPLSCSEKAPTHLSNLEVSGLSLLIPHASYIIFQLVPSQNTTPCSTYSDPWHCPVLQYLQQRSHVSLDSFLPTDSNMTYLACTSDHALFY